ncbi:MAG: helix-turn-helix domain-containing protein [Chloroflexi bacterium]|nr:helix-turn-helix domain-containing protein [Chloroflexota bacterium]
MKENDVLQYLARREEDLVTVQDLAEALGLPVFRTEALLDRLRARRLVTEVHGFVMPSLQGIAQVRRRAN